MLVKHPQDAVRDTRVVLGRRTAEYQCLGATDTS